MHTGTTNTKSKGFHGKVLAKPEGTESQSYVPKHLKKKKKKFHQFNEANSSFNETNVNCYTKTK